MRFATCRSSGLRPVRSSAIDMTFVRPSTYGLHEMAVGESKDFPAPTPNDNKRIARRASAFGIKHDRCYRCKTNKKTRITTITRIR